MPVQVHTVIEEIDIRVKKQALEAAKISVKRLDDEIIKLFNSSQKLEKGSLEFAKFTKEYAKLKKEQADLNNIIADAEKGTFSKLQDKFTSLTSGAGLAGKALGALGVAFGAFQVVNFIKSSITAAAEIEKTAKAFEAFGIPAKEAFELANKIDNLAAKVPFESEEINRVSKNLVKFNIAARDIPKTIEQLAAVAKGADFSLESLSDTFGRANKNGVVFGRDFLQVYKNIPGLVDAIAKSTGKTNAEIVKLGKAGRITFDQFNSGIQEVTSSTGKYGQVLTQFQNSFDGVLKSTKEEFGNILEETGKELLPSIKEGLTGLKDIALSLIPVFKVFGQTLGAAFSAVGNLLKGISGAPSKIKEFFQAIEDGRVSFGGRFLKIDERKGTRDLTDEMKKIVDRSFDNIEKHIEIENKKRGLSIREKILAGLTGKKLDVELSEEEIAKIAEKRQKLAEQRQKLQDEIDNFKKTLDSVKFDNQQVQFRLEGLDRFADKAQIIKEAQDKINALTDGFEKISKEAKKVGIKIPIELQTNLEEQKSLIALEADRQIKELFKDIEVTAPITVKPVVTVLDFEVDNPQERFNKKINDIFAGLKKDFAGIHTQFSKTSGANTPDRSFLAKLLGVADDEQGKEVQKLFTDALDTFAEKSLEAADVFIEAQLSKTDFLISESERRMSKLLEIQEGGNVDQINLEQERLDKLNAQRADFLEKQDALNKLQILGNNALTISEGIKSVAQAFGSPGGLITGIATSLALAATIAATIASLTTNINSIPSFFEGTESVGRKSGMKPQLNRQRDRYLIAVDEDERVLTGKQNRRIPRHIKNDRVPELVNKGITYETRFEKHVNRVSEFVKFNSVPGESATRLEAMPAPKDLGVRPQMTVVINNDRIERQQERTNKILERIEKKETNQNIILKIESDQKEKLRLAKLAK